MNYKTLELAIAKWAVAEPAVQALVVIGSRARKDHPADAWSDLDLILFVTEPQQFVDDSIWLEALGPVWLRVLNFTGAGDPEWMVLFAGGYKADFILTEITDRLDDKLTGSFYAKAARRGMRILIDKTGTRALATTPLARNQTWARPTQDEFAALMQQFLLALFRAGSMLKRGELWRARTITDGPLRQQLLRMLEWHARAKKGSAYDTWYEGRFLEDWLDRQLLAQLPEIFAPYNRSATGQVIFALMRLMDNLGQETAASWGYPYPIPNQIQIRDWIITVLRPDQVIARSEPD